MRIAALVCVLILASCAPAQQDVSAARALVMMPPLPPMRSFVASAKPPPTRSNVEIARDFLDLSFVLESGRELPVLTRFEEPVTVRLAGPIPPSLPQDLRALLGRLRNEAGIDIALAASPGTGPANITIEAVPQSAMQRAVPGAACFVVPRVTSWAEFLRARRSTQIDWTTLTRRETAAIFVPADASPQEIRDCLHEELAQALGPLNDLYSLADSVFNDDNIHTVLTGFDMLILRAYYDPALSNGMTRRDVADRLPAILSRLNPAGQKPATTGPRANATPRIWVEAIAVALSPASAPQLRRQAASRAVTLAQASGWTGPRAGFSYYVHARLNVQDNPEVALASFLQAVRIYRSAPDMRIHAAHVAVQLAAFALSTGDAANTLSLTEAAIPVAAAHENAALLATLLMFRAEALYLDGRPAEAAATRLDSLGWARYGFGSDNEVRVRLRDINALNPQRQGQGA